MRSNLWRLVKSTLAVVGLLVVWQRAAAIAEEPSNARPVGLIPADSDTMYFLNQARKLLEAEYYADAIPVLHELLKNPDERAFPTDQTERNVLRNLRVEAERLTGQMPAAGRDSYELMYGAEARWMLEQAISEYDFEQLAEVSRRFFHTVAGREATTLLAESQLRRGRPLNAAAWFQRARQWPNAPDVHRNVISLEMAIAWSLAGVPDQAEQCLLDLKKANPDGEVLIGDRTIRLFDEEKHALDWLDEFIGIRRQLQPSATEPADWELATVTKAWESSTSSWKVPVDDAPFSRGRIDVRRQIDGIAADFIKRELPPMPVSRPSVAGDLVVLRSPIRLYAVDLNSGQPKWMVDSENVFEKVRRGDIPPLPGDRGSILDPMLRDRIFENETYGRFAVIDRAVICVEGLGFSATQIGVSSFNQRTAASHQLATKNFNILTAYRITDGGRIWSVGGENGGADSNLAEHFFLGSPLPLGEMLYCLAEQNRRIRLVALDRATGKLVWSKWLQEYATDVSQDADRSRGGLTPIHAAGLLVCPTGSGAVTTVDLATHQLLWSYRYRELAETGISDQMRMIALARLAAIRGKHVNAKSQDQGSWRFESASMCGDRLVLTPRDSDQLHCLDLHDGTVLWKQPKGDRCFVEPCSDGRLLVVGNRQVELLQVDSGQPVWNAPLKIALPTGRGTAIGHRYYLPLQTNEIAIVDLSAGEIQSRVALDVRPGNLVFSGEQCVMQTTDSLVCVRPAAVEQTAE